MAESTLEDPGRADWHRHMWVALAFGLPSGIVSYVFAPGATALSAASRAFLRDLGLRHDDLMQMALPAGLIFGITAAIFAIWHLRWRAVWALLLPLWSIATMWLATFAAVFAFTEGQSLMLPFLLGSFVGTCLSALPALVQTGHLPGRQARIAGLIAPTLTAGVLGLSAHIDGSGVVFLLLFPLWQSLVLLSWALVTEEGSAQARPP